jgi:hypothetical protein
VVANVNSPNVYCYFSAHESRGDFPLLGGAEMSNLIREHLDELLKSFGRVNPPIDPTILQTLYDRKDYPAMLGWIKNSMRLNLQVGLRIVDRPETSPPMWIETPNAMPIYGTAEFNRVRAIVNVRRDILETKPFTCIVAGFAHELSHVVLFSIGHKLQHDEKAVDLTAMILGYRRYISDAEVTKTKGALLSTLLMLLLLPLGIMFWAGTKKEKWRLGYLTSTEALAACQYLAKIERAQHCDQPLDARATYVEPMPSRPKKMKRAEFVLWCCGVLTPVILIALGVAEGLFTRPTRQLENSQPLPHPVIATQIPRSPTQQAPSRGGSVSPPAPKPTAQLQNQTQLVPPQQKVQIPAIAHESKNDLVAVKIETGVIRKKGKGALVSPLTIEADAGNYALQLVDSKSNNEVLMIFVGANQTFKTKVPLGTYKIFYATGSVWYGEEQLFGPATTYFVMRRLKGSSIARDDEFPFTLDDKTYVGWTIHLQKRPGGDLSTDPITPGEFKHH